MSAPPQQQRFKRWTGLHPGATGLLFTANPLHEDKAKREIEALLSVALEARKKEKSSLNGGADQNCADETRSISQLLASELDAVRNQSARGRRRGGTASALLRWLDTNCRGYIFAAFGQEELCPKSDKCEGPACSSCCEASENSTKPPEDSLADEPPKQKLRVETHDGESTDSPAEAPQCPTPHSAESPNCGEGDTVPPSHSEAGTEGPSPLTATWSEDCLWIAEHVLNDLCSFPRPVSRFAFRMYPVATSCNPTTDCLVAAVDRALAALVERSDPLPAAPAPVMVHFSIRNNTNVERQKPVLLAAVEQRILRNARVCLQKYHCNNVLVILVIHSTACVGIQTQMERRKGYNLHELGNIAQPFEAAPSGSGQPVVKGS